MLGEGWGEILRPLGVAIPLVAILLYLLKQATDERRLITADFLLTLRETIKSGAENNALVAARMQAMASEISALNIETQERRAAATAEHKEMMQALSHILGNRPAFGGAT